MGFGEEREGDEENWEVVFRHLNQMSVMATWKPYSWEPEDQRHSEKMICSAFCDYGSASRNSAESQKYFLKCICMQHVHHSSCPCSWNSGAERLLVQAVHCVSCYNLPQNGCSRGQEVPANTAQFPLRDLRISRFLFSHSILEPNLMNTKGQL